MSARECPNFNVALITPMHRCVDVLQCDFDILFFPAQNCVAYDSVRGAEYDMEFLSFRNQLRWTDRRQLRAPGIWPGKTPALAIAIAPGLKRRFDDIQFE